MFETAMLSSGPATKRVWATCAGFTGQALLVGFALLAPMIWPQVIPHASWIETVAPPGLPRGRPAREAKVEPRRAPRPLRPMACLLCEPVEVPKDIKVFAEPPDAGPIGGGDDRIGVVGSPWSDLTDRLAIGVAAQVPPAKRPAPRPAPPAAVAPAPAAAPPRISVVELARPIHRVEPIYPKLAIAAHVQGVVQLMGVLGTDGRIRELKAMSGHPMLVNAAVEAVRQWVYAPTLLNGQPVEVQAPIQVNFILNR